MKNREQLIKEINDLKMDFEQERRGFSLLLKIEKDNNEKLWQIIRNLQEQAINREEVVYCKDCKYSTEASHQKGYFCGINSIGFQKIVRDDDYCSRGEKK